MTSSNEGQMPTVQFNDPSLNKVINRRMFAPKTATTRHWYKEARSAIPDIPDLKKTTWTIHTEDVDLKWIKFTLVNPEGQRCYVVIDRTTPSLGTI
jgi:hypothetical protein